MTRVPYGCAHKSTAMACYGAPGVQQVRAWVIWLLAMCMVTGQASWAARRYLNIPVGTNIVAVEYSDIIGNLGIATSLQVGETADLASRVWNFSYTHVFDWNGQSALTSVVLPYSELSGIVETDTETISDSDEGWADPLFVIGTKFSGAPALELHQFQRYIPKTIVGWSLSTSVPLGKYDNEGLLNVGTNRWSFKPEIAVTKRDRRWLFEGYGNVTFYTDNDEYRGDSRLQRDPLWGLEGYVSYDITRSVWVSFETIWRYGGETTVDGVAQENAANTLRLGSTVSYSPVPAWAFSVKYYDDVISSGGIAASFWSLGAQYRFGGGL